MSESNENQTSFGLEKPLFEEPPFFAKPALSVNEAEEPKPKNTRQKWLIIGGITIVALLALLLGVLMLFRTPGTGLSDTFNFNPIIENSPPSEMQLRVKSLQEELTEADPAKRDYPFPPIDMDIRLDPRPSR